MIIIDSRRSGVLPLLWLWPVRPVSSGLLGRLRRSGGNSPTRSATLFQAVPLRIGDVARLRYRNLEMFGNKQTRRSNWVWGREEEEGWCTRMSRPDLLPRQILLRERRGEAAHWFPATTAGKATVIPKNLKLNCWFTLQKQNVLKKMLCCTKNKCYYSQLFHLNYNCNFSYKRYCKWESGEAEKSDVRHIYKSSHRCSCFCVLWWLHRPVRNNFF